MKQASQGSSCCEIQWHSWIGFASEASFAYHIDISMVAQFELEDILGHYISVQQFSSTAAAVTVALSKRDISDYFNFNYRNMHLTSHIEIPLKFPAYCVFRVYLSACVRATINILKN